MDSGHLLTHSCLTILEVSLTVPLGFFCLLFRGFLFSVLIYNEAFYVHVATNYCIPVFCPKLELYLVPFNLCVCFIICPSVSYSVTHFVSAAVILLTSLASLVQFSLPYNKAVWATLLYNSILFSLKFSVV